MTAPASLNLPSKFREFRPGQLRALGVLSETSKRWVIVQAPTGTGKTLLAAAAQRMLNTRMLYVVKTKQLQDQILDDFPYAQVLKGRANYPTLNFRGKFPHINASLCTKSRENHCRWCCDREDAKEERCNAPRDCPYHVAKAHVLGAKDLGVLNISLFLAEANYVGGFSGWPWVTLDEADTLESSLMSAVEFRLPKRLVQTLHIPPPDRKTKEESWVRWAKESVRPALTERLEKAQSEWSIENLKEEEELTRALARLEFFLSDVETAPWVYTPSDEYVLKPVFIAKHANHYLWRHGERFLLMSATIIDPRQTARDLGIPYSDVEFVDLPSEFDPRRRPVYYLPAASVSHATKSTAYPVLLKGLDKSLDLYGDRKVLVHTVSASLARYVYEHSRHSGRMLVYGFNGLGREKVLETFKASEKPAVLVAQSMDRGVDLPDALARVVIILKVPYPDLGDRQVSKRVYASKDGKSWYQTQTWRTLVQMSGRGMRHERDSCVVEILDAQFGERLWPQSKRLAPRWWTEALVMDSETVNKTGNEKIRKGGKL